MKTYTQTLTILFTPLISLWFTGCETSGHTTRIETSQLGEYREATSEDLKEFSSRMFQNMIRSNLFHGNSRNPALISVCLHPAQITEEFNDNQRLIDLKRMITRSGVAQFSGQLQVYNKQEFINFARSQKGRTGGDQPHYILEQHLEEHNRRYEKKHIIKTYMYTLELIDITPNSPALGRVVLAENEKIVKRVRK